MTAPAPGVVHDDAFDIQQAIAQGVASALNAVNERQNSYGRKRSVVAGCQVGTVGGTANTTTGTARKRYKAIVPFSHIQLVFANFTNSGASAFADTDNTVALTGVEASVEDQSGNIYRCTVSGANASPTFNVGPGGIATTEPIPLFFEAGDVFAVRTFMPSGQSWFTTAIAQNAGNATGDGGFVATTDLTAPGSGAVAESSFANMWMPIAILGIHRDGSKPVVVLIGDSLTFGNGDGGWAAGGAQVNVDFPRLGSGGAWARAFGAAGIPTVNLGTPGDLAANQALQSKTFRRFTFSADGTTVYEACGRNDFTAGNTSAQVAASRIALWRKAGRSGLRVLASTISPNSSSTDLYLTTVNQTTAANNPSRIAHNQWMRDGAPLVPGTYVAAAVGSTGNVVRAGQAGHPLYAIDDLASVMETSTDSGIWKAPVIAAAVTDGAITTGTNQFLTSQYIFTAADIGRVVYIPGAGASGALFVATITHIAGGGASVLLAVNASTTVSGAAAKVADTYTLDGTHPNTYGAEQIALAINVSNVS